MKGDDSGAALDMDVGDIAEEFIELGIQPGVLEIQGQGVGEQGQDFQFRPVHVALGGVLGGGELTLGPD